MEIRQAISTDLPVIAQLEQTHLKAELNSDSASMLGQGFSLQQLTAFLENGWIVVAEEENKIIGYVICADWRVFKQWPIYNALLNFLSREHSRLSSENTCQYGPIWIDEGYRGKGLFQQLVSEVKKLSSRQYPTMITFVAEDNQRSYFAHTQKGQMTVLDFFEFDDRGYYLLSL